ncbi:alpha/beta hydrolase family protein [Thermogladius sp. 4427co]|uniref:alpha/beta hydrolase family protein n=1 Tax=Thermogladius sp. 4427co TaxID=3450718 RepID=UPI003F78E9EC
MSNISRIVKIVEDIIYTPTYTLLGIDYKGRVVYHTLEGGFNSIWVLDPSRGKIRLSEKTVHWPGEVSLNGTRVPFTRDVGAGRETQVIGYIDLVNEKEFVLENMEPVRILGFFDTGSEIAFAGASKERISLFLVKKDSVEELARLDSYAHVSFFDGKVITGSGNLRKNPKSSEIFIYDLSSNELKVVTPREGSVNESPIITTSKKLVFESNAYTGDAKELVVYDLYRDRFEKLVFREKDYSEYKPVEHLFYREFNGKLYVIGKKDGRSKLFVDGRVIETPAGTVLNAYPHGELIYFTYTSLKKPTGIYVYDKGVSREVLVSKLPAEVEESFGDIEFVKIKSFDGVEVPTFIFKTRKPRGAFVVYVHGGPWWETADEWNTRIAPLVALGFNIVAPNFRGSTGYGERFRLMDIGDPGGGDLLDVEAATKWALENKLGEKALIWGYSYGGYMTLWAMFQRPDLYECGVAGAPVADWEEMYELSDAVFKEFINILFDNKRELWKQRSPSTYASNLKKPLAIIQPQNDTRTPLKPVLNLVYKLMESGKTFELHVIPEAGHAITTPDKLAIVMTHASIFLDKCVGK